MLWNETNPHFCRGNLSSSVFPQRLRGNLRVITFLSARANYKAGGEAGGGSTAWRRDISVLLSNSLLESLLGPSSSCHLSLNLPFTSSSFLSSHLSFIPRFLCCASLLFYPHPSTLHPSLLPSCLYILVLVLAPTLPRSFRPFCSSSCFTILRFWYISNHYTTKKYDMKSIKYPLRKPPVLPFPLSGSLLTLNSPGCKRLLITGAGRLINCQWTQAAMQTMFKKQFKKRAQTQCSRSIRRWEL